MLPSDRTRRKQWCCLALMIIQLVNYTIGSPIFSNSMQFSQFQTARNIRHLPCVVRVSGLKGVCMFAIDCIKANGTHLGTCIDKFYFGSCCQMKMEDALYNPEINDNSIDSAFPPSYQTNYISKKPYIQVSTVALPSSLQPYNTKATTTKRPHIYNNKTYEFVSSSTKVPHFNTTTVNYSVNFGGFSTTLGTITQRNLTTILMRDETTTEKIKFSTFQSIQNGLLKNATQMITKSTTMLPKTTKRMPSTTTVKSVSITNKPLKVSSKQPKPSVGVTVKPTTAPIKVTSKITTQTSKPATAIINKVKVTTRTPTVTTVKPLKDKTTISTTGTTKLKQTTTTPNPRRSTTVAPKRTTTVTTAASTSVETTRAPRPKPQPTSEIVKVEPTTIYQDIITSTANPQLFANKNTAITTEKTKTSSATLTTKRPTKKPATPAPTTTTRLTTKQPITTSSSTTVKATTASEQLIYSPTSKKPLVQDDQITTTPGGFFTWTLSSNLVDNTTKSDEWVLISSVSPSTSVLPSSDEMSEKQSTIALLEKIPSTIDLTTSKLTTSSKTTTTTTEAIDTTEYSEEITDQPTTVDDNEPSTVDASSEYTTIDNEDNKLIITTEQTDDETQTETAMEEETTNAIDEDDDDDDDDDDKTTNVTTESGIDENVSIYANETSSIPTSTMPNLEGIDYKLICGKRMFPEPRIVGGAKASFGRWPWQISLRQWRTSTYLHKCGAALLNENWAISAAHCVDNVPPSDLLLRLGEYDLSIEEEPYGYQERRVQIVASHPQFDPRTFEYDLALLRFYEPVVFQPNIIPVCVPEDDENFIGRNAYVTGWGRLYEDGPLPSVLQEVTVPVIKNDICESMYRSAGYIEHIPHIFICAGWKKGGYDSCEGDSGGPMVIQRNDKRFQLTGVISWGIGCAEPNQPGVYTRISEFRDWINQILQF